MMFRNLRNVKLKNVFKITNHMFKLGEGATVFSQKI